MNKKKDLFFMSKALSQAKIAFKREEVPVGALIVDSSGNIISRSYNKVEKINCQVAHAEILAIQKACKKFGDWRLDGCWLYVTLEPCLMCFGLIQLSRLKGVVFGTKSDCFGSCADKARIKKNLYNKDLIIRGGVREIECVEILKRFFKIARKKDKNK